MNSPAPEICTHSTCVFSNCQGTCALQVIDELLRSQGSVRGDEVDGLLDLRWMLRSRDDAEAALTLFCKLRRAMEERHYLSFYRLRRSLENQIKARVRIVRGAPERTVALKLDWYCLEAIRFQCLHAGKQPGERPLAPRVCFTFHPVTQPLKNELSTTATFPTRANVSTPHPGPLPV